MVESCRLESGGLVAIDAIAVGWHVVVIFARSGNAVVTGGTVVGYALVIERGLGKRRGHMAHRAILGADRNMRRIGLGGGTGCDHGIVARDAVVDDASMIEYRRLETAARNVAGAAILGSRHVAGVHAFCAAGTIGNVTGIATHGQHRGIGVIDERVGKIYRIMAQGTILGSYRMWW